MKTISKKENNLKQLTLLPLPIKVEDIFQYAPQVGSGDRYIDPKE